MAAEGRHKPEVVGMAIAAPAIDSSAATPPRAAGYRGSSCVRFVADTGSPFASPVIHGRQGKLRPGPVHQTQIYINH